VVNMENIFAIHARKVLEGIFLNVTSAEESLLTSVHIYAARRITL